MPTLLVPLATLSAPLAPTLSSTLLVLGVLGVRNELPKNAFSLAYTLGGHGGAGFPISKLSFFPNLSHAMWQQAYVRAISSSGFNVDARARDCATREVASSVKDCGSGETVGSREESEALIWWDILVVRCFWDVVSEEREGCGQAGGTTRTRHARHVIAKHAVHATVASSARCMNSKGSIYVESRGVSTLCNKHILFARRRHLLMRFVKSSHHPSTSSLRSPLPLPRRPRIIHECLCRAGRRAAHALDPALAK